MLDAEPFISWKNPNTEMLIDYVTYKLNWEPSFIRQKLFPLLSTIFLRNIAKNQETDLLYGQYEFDFIRRTKIRFGHTFYVVTWKKSTQTVNNNIYTTPSKEPEVQEDCVEVIEILDESDVSNVHVDNGCLMTDENMDLVMAAYPEKVNQFIQQKVKKKILFIWYRGGKNGWVARVRLGLLQTLFSSIKKSFKSINLQKKVYKNYIFTPTKVNWSKLPLVFCYISVFILLISCLNFLQEAKVMKSKKKSKAKSASTPDDVLSPTSRSVQLNITQFYRSSKGETTEKLKADGFSTEKRNSRSGNFSKSARRRLLLG